MLRFANGLFGEDVYSTTSMILEKYLEDIMAKNNITKNRDPSTVEFYVNTREYENRNIINCLIMVDSIMDSIDDTDKDWYDTLSAIYAELDRIYREEKVPELLKPHHTYVANKVMRRRDILCRGAIG